MWLTSKDLDDLHSIAGKLSYGELRKQAPPGLLSAVQSISYCWLVAIITTTLSQMLIREWAHSCHCLCVVCMCILTAVRSKMKISEAFTCSSAAQELLNAGQVVTVSDTSNVS